MPKRKAKAKEIVIKLNIPKSWFNESKDSLRRNELHFDMWDDQKYGKKPPDFVKLSRKALSATKKIEKILTKNPKAKITLLAIGGKKGIYSRERRMFASRALVVAAKSPVKGFMVLLCHRNEDKGYRKYGIPKDKGVLMSTVCLEEKPIPSRNRITK